MTFDKIINITRQDDDGNFSFTTVPAGMIVIEGYETFKFFAFYDAMDKYGVIPGYNVSEFTTGMQVAIHHILIHAIDAAKIKLDGVGVNGFAKMLAKRLNDMPHPANT